MLLRLYYLLTRLMGGVVINHLRGDPRFEGTLDERTGKELPEWDSSGTTVWLHGVSVGEVTALAPVAKEWKERFPEHNLLVTTTTSTGRERAGDLVEETADEICYFPLDLPRALRRWADHFRPDLMVAFEAEAWPNLLGELQDRDTRTAQANGRISLHNKEWGPVRSFFQGLYRRFDLILPQSELMERRYRELLADSVPLETTGNTKYSDYPEEPDGEFLAELRRALGWEEDARPLMVASTHPLEEDGTEERLILQQLAELDDDLLPEELIVAPRHPERAGEVRELLENGPLPRKGVASLEKLLDGASYSGADTLLVDTIGHLSKLYPLCELAVIGGTFNSTVGGHNLYEAAQHGVVTVIGPHNFTIEPETDSLSEAGALEQVEEGEELADALAGLLEAPEDLHQRGERGVEVVRQSTGSAQRTVHALAALLERGPGAERAAD